MQHLEQTSPFTETIIQNSERRSILPVCLKQIIPICVRVRKWYHNFYFFYFNCRKLDFMCDFAWFLYFMMFDNFLNACNLMQFDKVCNMFLWAGWW